MRIADRRHSHRLRDGVHQRGARGRRLEVAVLLLERGNAFLDGRVGLHLCEKATRADGLNQRRPRDGAFIVLSSLFLAFVYMPRPSLTMASATMEPICRTTSSVVDPTVLARVFLTLSQTFGSLMESR